MQERVEIIENDKRARWHMAVERTKDEEGGRIQIAIDMNNQLATDVKGLQKVVERVLKPPHHETAARIVDRRRLASG